LEFINKRNKNILKVKKFYDDEGVVQKINYKNGRMKSLIIKLKNSITFNLGNGFTKEQRLNPPKIGEQVTFKYYGLSKYGKPKFASFLRVRKQE
jgi:DNA ligase-1